MILTLIQQNSKRSVYNSFLLSFKHPIHNSASHACNLCISTDLRPQRVNSMEQRGNSRCANATMSPKTQAAFPRVYVGVSNNWVSVPRLHSSLEFCLNGTPKEHGARPSSGTPARMMFDLLLSLCPNVPVVLDGDVGKTRTWPASGRRIIESHYRDTMFSRICSCTTGSICGCGRLFFHARSDGELSIGVSSLRSTRCLGISFGVRRLGSPDRSKSPSSRFDIRTTRQSSRSSFNPYYTIKMLP